jgi:hypothetical protein
MKREWAGLHAVLRHLVPIHYFCIMLGVNCLMYDILVQVGSGWFIYWYRLAVVGSDLGPFEYSSSMVTSSA